MSAICARPSKGKGEIYKRVENRRLSTLLCARAASAQFRSPRRRNHLKKENLKKEIDQRQVEKDTLESELYSIHANITEVKQDFKAAAKEMPSVDYFMKERDPKKIETVKKKDGTFWQRVGFDFKVFLKMQNWIKKYILPLREKEKQIDKRIEYVQERSKSVLADIKAKGTRTDKTASKQAERSREYER